jgi:two-component system, NarL family, response regulator NreC
MHRLRVLLADDHLVLRDGLRALLERADFEVLGASDGREAVELAQDQRPDIAVLDLAMPVLNGLDAARHIGQVSPRTGVIILTMHAEAPYVSEALRAGVRGYVLKTQAARDLVQAIEQVARGLTYLSPGVTGPLVEAYLGNAEAPPDPLTLREREVLQLVAEGKTTKEIADVLGVSAKTIESHRARLMKKLHIHDTAGLVRYAVRRGLVEA